VTHFLVALWPMYSRPISTIAVPHQLHTPYSPQVLWLPSSSMQSAAQLEFELHQEQGPFSMLLGGGSAGAAKDIKVSWASPPMPGCGMRRKTKTASVTSWILQVVFMADFSSLARTNVF
jgi:hypothetical protein